MSSYDEDLQKIRQHNTVCWWLSASPTLGHWHILLLDNTHDDDDYDDGEHYPDTDPDDQAPGKTCVSIHKLFHSNQIVCLNK